MCPSRPIRRARSIERVHSEALELASATLLLLRGGMATPTLTSAERALLREVRLSDEDHGGLAGEELSTDEYERMDRLCTLGLVEAVGEYGEAPDGEEDEREAGAAELVYRVTAGGVAALLDDPGPDTRNA
jgi:hypothetical protein